MRVHNVVIACAYMELLIEDVDDCLTYLLETPMKMLKYSGLSTDQFRLKSIFTIFSEAVIHGHEVTSGTCYQLNH